MERRDELDDRDEKRLLVPRTYRGRVGIEVVEAELEELEEDPLPEDWMSS